jgi:hypothetical protein
LIGIHNKSTYKRFYNEFSTIFIDTYCFHKSEGYETQEALFGAKLAIQNLVAIEISRKNKNAKLIAAVYENLKGDSEIIEKAIQYYQSMK